MHCVRLVVAALVAVVGLVSTPVFAKKPPKGFHFVPDWGVYASPDDVFWNDGVQWRLGTGGWLRLDAGRWVIDPQPPAVIIGIPPGQAHCPPGLAKKGCVPPGQRKKYGPPGHGKHR